MTGIYKIVSPSGKVYIGQSINIEGRKRHYKIAWCKGQPKLYNSIKKYGWGAHTFEVIHQLPTDVSPEVITTYEDFYINQYRSV